MSSRVKEASIFINNEVYRLQCSFHLPSVTGLENVFWRQIQFRGKRTDIYDT